MQQIIFATTNKGKVVTLQQELDRAGVEVQVVAKSLDITEIQAETALEVARDKAKKAYDLLKCPLVVDDSELRIEALNGFPGPYQKAMTEKLGPEGFVRLMQGYDDRRAYFISNLVYVDERGELHEFSDDPYRVEIAEQVDAYDNPDAWGPLWKIIVLPGTNRVQSQLSRAELAAYNASLDRDDAYEKFVEWYTSAS